MSTVQLLLSFQYLLQTAMEYSFIGSYLQRVDHKYLDVDY